MFMIVYMNLSNLDRNTVLFIVKEIRNEMETTEIWNKQCITLLEIKVISCKLHENFIMKTLNIFNTDKYPKLRTYRTEFRLENYLLT